RNRFADEAIQGMRAQDDAAYLEPLLKALRTSEKQFTSSGFGRGLETLGFLARNEEKKTPYREFILEYVNSKRQRVQLAAVAALGTLGDPKALAVLEKFVGEPKESPLRITAEKSMTTLRDSKKPSAELGSLRT